MIACASTGSNFGGLVKYMTHDPPTDDIRNPQSADRVAWTETQNLETDDPALAARIMAGVVRDAPMLKQLAGVSGRGRKLKDPVLHLILSWPPGVNPAKQEMLAATKGALKTLGLEEHQAVTVAHKDRDHNHTHTAVNRVSTIDGRAVKLQQSGRRLSAWAEQYEREHGGIRIPNRVERRQILNEPRKPNERRRKLPPMQRRTGPGRSPRLPAERRGWTRHYQRQRAAAETARQAGRKPDPAVERRRRVRVARRQRMIRPVRIGIAAGQTAVTALGRTTTRRIRSAATRARTTAIATTRRIQSVAATITPRPRTDAERNERANQRALAHVNQDRPPGVLHHIVSPVMAAGAAAVTAVARGAAAARSVLTPTPATPPRPDRLELAAEMKSHGLPSPAERSAKWAPPPSAAAPRAGPPVHPVPASSLSYRATASSSALAKALVDAVDRNDREDLAALQSLVAYAHRSRNDRASEAAGPARTDRTRGSRSRPVGGLEATRATDAGTEAAHRAPEAAGPARTDRTRGGETPPRAVRAEPTRPAVRGGPPVQPPPSTTPPSRRPAVRGREREPAPSATLEQELEFRKLKGLGEEAGGRAWYYKSLGKVAPGVRPGEETSEQVDQALELAFEHFRPRPRPEPAREPDPPRPARPQVKDRGRGRDF